MVLYNNVREKDRIARKGAMLPYGGVGLPDGYITSGQRIVQFLLSCSKPYF